MKDSHLDSSQSVEPKRRFVEISAIVPVTLKIAMDFLSEVGKLKPLTTVTAPVSTDQASVMLPTELPAVTDKEWLDAIL